MKEITREFPFTSENFHYLRKIASEHAGIDLGEYKQELVYSRLTKRLRQLRLLNFDSYCNLIKSGDIHELKVFLNAITTNITYFFREKHHFVYLRQHVLPDLLNTNHLTKRIRIWSAGCSSGEEPYSIAITCLETVPKQPPWDIKILATDIDSDILSIAKEGVYPIEKIEQLDLEHQRLWFLKGVNEQKNLVKVKSELKKIVYFKELNLISPWPMHGPFDIIFCRNVAIYFNKKTQKEVFEKFANQLAPHGVLVIGHSESLFKVSDRFELINPTIYRKIK